MGIGEKMSYQVWAVFNRENHSWEYQVRPSEPYANDFWDSLIKKFSTVEDAESFVKEIEGQKPFTVKSSENSQNASFYPAA